MARADVEAVIQGRTIQNLKAESFYKPRLINGPMACADARIKTFPLRGVKDSAPYLHDGRLLTLEDTVELFNLILELGLSAREKKIWGHLSDHFDAT